MMKPSKVRALLKVLLPARESVLIKGTPGIGKTEVTKQAVKELGYDHLIMHPVIKDPTDFKGLPALTKGANGESLAQFLPYGDLRQLMAATNPLVVIMDDAGQAPPAVQAAMMQLVQERAIDGHSISDEVIFVMLTNRRQDMAAVGGVITPLLDRFTLVIEMGFDVSDWTAWAAQHQIRPEIIAFVRFRPDLIGSFHPNLDMEKSPTPRSVVNLSRLMDLGVAFATEDEYTTEEADGAALDYEVVKGAVGKVCAVEFVAFYRTWTKLPDRTTIYQSPETAPVPSTDTPDVLYALMGSIAYGATSETYPAILKYLERVPEEFRAMAVVECLNRTPELRLSTAHRNWLANNGYLFGLHSG